MTNVRLSQRQLENVAGELMMKMETTTVYTDNEIKAQLGHWGKEQFALFWEVDGNGRDRLYKVMSESHTFTS